jgi:MoaA/NifB/PqqE/SkfB family radical SAM enzyme
MKLEIDLTNWCTLKCEGCLSKSKESKRELDINKIPKNTHIYEKIIICGDAGEPLLHSRINDILSILSLSNKVEISTNLEIDVLDLDKLRVFKDNLFFEISIDGPNNIIHSITRKNGKLENVLKNSMKLYKAGFNISFIYTRHLQNEIYVNETRNLIKKMFNIELLFRDTSHITSVIHPPTKLSKNGCVSILYRSPVETYKKKSMLLHIYKVVPRPNIYVKHTGEIFPCVSFHNFKQDVSHLELREQCEYYRKKGDIVKCCLNCGIYNNFKYDSIEDINDK